MNFRETRARRRPDAQLELTALIDVVFLLLLFFLITTTFVHSEDRQLPLNLPSAAAGESVAPGARVVVYVQEDGSLQIDEEQIRSGEMRAHLEAMYNKDPGMQLLVKGDKDTAYGAVTNVIDEARLVGFNRVNLVVKRKPSP